MKLKRRRSFYQALRDKGLSGSMKGPPDLPTNTRTYIPEVLDRKKQQSGT